MPTAILKSEAITARAHFEQLARTGYWANLYTEYTDPRIRWSFLRRQALLEQMLAELTRPGALVVEIGPGTGNLIPLVAARGARYRGYDVAPAMVDATRAEIARCAAPTADLQCNQGDIYQIPLPAASADVVVASGVLEYLDRPDAAAAELARITRPGGHALISFPSAASLNRILGRNLTFITAVSRGVKKLLRIPTDAPDIHRECYTPARIRSVFQPAGWETARINYYDVEVLPYPLNRLAPNLAFAAKRRAESSQAAPRALLANAMVVQFGRSD